MQAPSSEWFCTLLDTSPDVYFRYALVPRRAFAYVSPAVQALTGHAPDAFYADRNLCLSILAPSDRRHLRRILRARRAVTLTLHLMRHDVALPIEVRTVALVRRARVVAIEGSARLLVTSIQSRAGSASAARPSDEPTQQRLAALMVEVHDLLHRVLPPATAPVVMTQTMVLRIGDLTLDPARMTVTDAGSPVVVTPREVQVLRYLLERTDRVVTRRQLLEEVWSYAYTGDDRTVDVHISRLRRKCPSLAGRLVALRNIGYRLQEDRRAATA